ncbi:hypothetical protein SLIQ_20430 [Serratia liquefaciens FK01]|nr:hypothetical protein SLIQ_20430 [Serratia liquefaciens FK01]
MLTGKNTPKPGFGSHRKIDCDQYHNLKTNTHQKNVINITFNGHLSDFCSRCGFFTLSKCDRDHYNCPVDGGCSVMFVTKNP